MKVTIDQETNSTLYRGEDKTFTVYVYDEATFEPIDLTVYDEIIVCFLNDDTSTLDVTATQTTSGKFTFPVTAAESLLLAVQQQSLQVKFNVTSGPTSNIEVFSNYINVVDPAC